MASKVEDGGKQTLWTSATGGKRTYNVRPNRMEQLPLTIPFQRLMGFTIPDAGCFFVCDQNECWSVHLGRTPEISECDGSPYDLAARPDFIGAGVGNNELLKAGRTEIAYDFRPTEEFVAVRWKSRGTSGAIEFGLISGDWFIASLSTDGAYAVLAEPDALLVYAAT